MDSRDNSRLWIKVVRWAARLWSIPAILFVGGHIVSPDTNGGAEVFWYEWLAVGTMFASVFALLLAWWKEKIGGWASLALVVAAVIIYTLYAGEFFSGWWILLVGVAVPAGLFLAADRMNLRQAA